MLCRCHDAVSMLCTPHTLQECLAGAIMGAGLGVVIYAFSLVWSGITAQVGLTVAVALPVREASAVPPYDDRC